jgi:hypothetical protein
MNNNIWNILALVAAILIGYFALTYTPAPQAPSDTASQGKIDINMVREGALAYMTFPDAAAAEVFVEECKAGEHPEVIDQYIQNLNIDAGATI